MDVRNSKLNMCIKHLTRVEFLLGKEFYLLEVSLKHKVDNIDLIQFAIFSEGKMFPYNY